MSPREFSLLLARGVAPEPLKEVPGRGGHRLFCSDGLSHAAVISGIHHAGLELLVAARLAAMLVDHYNLGQNGNLANFPDVEVGSSLYEAHAHLFTRPDLYSPGRSRQGDILIEIENGNTLTTGRLDFEARAYFDRGIVLSLDGLGFPPHEHGTQEKTDPVSLVFFNLSLAVRNAFDRMLQAKQGTEAASAF
ncbi:hypothetical protein JP75_01500 [Devosia riboflavina]|uniref:Uncharacterized protein n=1 Tax=Devosia riboflavina TaxID=46914 RepID=A0A087M7J2_9HYPH|nr:hypothetical protein JP75_01500 [Devosia riboflavina]